MGNTFAVRLAARHRQTEASHLLDTAGVAAVIVRRDGRLAFASQDACHLLGTGARRPNGWHDCRLPGGVTAGLAGLARQACVKGGNLRRTFLLPGRAGLPARHMEANAKALDGAATAILVLRDITDLMSREAEQQRFRNDTDQWRQEVRHRVRNTLHTLSALLHLQDQRAGTPDLSPHFEQVRGHILAMAQAHDTLEIRGGTPQVDIVACIRALHALACRAHGLTPDHLPLELTDGALPVPPSIDMAVPMALIVHEVFSLAASRAAHGQGRPLIVRLERIGQCGEISLAMEGLGVDDQCLNTPMIEALARQLRARIHHHPDRAGLTLRFSPS